MTESSFPARGAQTADGRLAALRNRIATTCHLVRVASVIWAVWTLGIIVYVYSDRSAFVARL